MTPTRDYLQDLARPIPSALICPINPLRAAEQMHCASLGSYSSWFDRVARSASFFFFLFLPPTCTVSNPEGLIFLVHPTT